MPGPYQALDLSKAHDNYTVYAAMHDLLSSHKGMTTCRELLRELGAKVKTGVDLQ